MTERGSSWLNFKSDKNKKCFAGAILYGSLTLWYCKLKVKTLKRSTELLFLLLVSAGLVYNELLLYGITQGYNQFKIIVKAKPINEILADENFPDSLKQKLRLIEEIRQFAFDSLELNHALNYTTFYDQQGKQLISLVTACESYSFKEKQWWFPVLGNVSYKGFFNKEKAEREAAGLLQQGYDVDIGGVGGWSTLDWFKDPVLSGMLKRSEGGLSNLIIHELTHGTLYVKDSVSFNENLASFIGHKGALRFLKIHFGDSSVEYRTYINKRADEKLFNEYMLKSKHRLDSLYKTFHPHPSEGFKPSEGLTDSEKDTLKSKLIREIVNGVDSLPLYNKTLYKSISAKALGSKNAFFVSFQQYDSRQEEFEKEFKEKFNSDIKKYLEYYKGRYPSL